MANVEIREAAAKAKVKHWQIAEEMGIHEGVLSRKLRHEVGNEEKEAILKAIKAIQEKGGA